MAERIAEYANLTVLERNCAHDLDTPDPACEYVLPGADFAFSRASPSSTRPHRACSNSHPARKPCS